MRIEPMAGGFGAVVRGVDLAQGVDDQVMGPLVAALHAHRLVIIKDQSLSREQYLAFGEAMGRPHPHALDHLRMPGYPALLEVGNTQPQHREASIRNGAAFWHTDQSYEAEPSSATMLYAIHVPARGGETLIADMAGAHEALDEETKAEIEGLEALHLYGAASGEGDEHIAAPITTGDQEKALPAVRHPIALAHPVTGRKALYSVAGTPYGIDGMAEREALALLARLKRHALADRFIHRRAHQVGDITLYDTLATLHSGVPIDFAEAEDNRRLLWRISVKGLPKVCRPN